MKIQQLDEFLCMIEDRAKINHVPIARPETAVFLEQLVVVSKPRRILEIGTAIGYSAIRMARHLSDEARLDTIERNEDRVFEARENIRLSGLQDRIHLIWGDAFEVLPSLQGPYDMVFMDAAKGQYGEFLTEVMRLTVPGSVIISDNLEMNGKTSAEGPVPRKYRAAVTKMRGFMDILRNEPELSTTWLAIEDGLAMSVRMK